jgi:hypothetical protein
MAEHVCMGAMLECTFGVTPCPLVATSAPTVLTSEMPAATIMDFVPEENIATFGMCSSMANPEVASATAAALGVLTPMPCVPATIAPWAPGSPTVLVGEFPALSADDLLVCMWGGEISITDPGQVTEIVAG